MFPDVEAPTKLQTYVYPLKPPKTTYAVFELLHSSVGMVLLYPALYSATAITAWQLLRSLGDSAQPWVPLVVNELLAEAMKGSYQRLRRSSHCRVIDSKR